MKCHSTGNNVDKMEVEKGSDRRSISNLEQFVLTNPSSNE